MGHGGRSYFLRGIIYYAVSPFQLKPFAGIWPMNLLSRMKREIFYVAPPLLLGWFVYVQGEQGHQRTLLKKPGDFDDEGGCMMEAEAEGSAVENEQMTGESSFGADEKPGKEQEQEKEE